MVTKQANSIEATSEFYKGQNGESILAYCLRQDGYYVHILADLKERGKTGAPGATNSNGFLTLPDLDVAKNGYRAFAEVKFKSVPSWTGCTGRDEHGIGLRSWQMYCKGYKTFGTPIFIFIYERKSGAVLYNPLNLLWPYKKGEFSYSKKSDTEFYYRDVTDRFPFARVYRGDDMDKGGMVFFPRASFSLWGKIATIDDKIYEQLTLPFDIPEVTPNAKDIFKVLRFNNA